MPTVAMPAAIQTDGGAGTKGDQRRRQVMEAAAECFRREGFHGTSIARISAVAGMSSGHIYHYFPNKESLIEAFVRQEENDLSELIHAMEQKHDASDLATVIAAHVDWAVERSTRPEHVSLMLEIAAEAARNPKIARMLQDSHDRTAKRFAAMAERLGGAGRAGTDAGLRARMEMMGVIFSGLGPFSIGNPALDKPRIAGLIKEILRSLWPPKA